MQVIAGVNAVRSPIKQWQQQGFRVAFVPTMGNLHAGHLSLVQRAKRLADKIVVSIFVNPLQFSADEDFSAYPRTLTQDRQLLTEQEVDLLFTPTASELYPHGLQAQTQVFVPQLTDILCGLSRPGHFLGMATIVCKLFNIVQPEVAIFGEKDFQQLLIIRRMVQDLCLPIKIISVGTVRDEDGLALSSRNNYLSLDERKIAPKLYAILLELAAAIRSGQRNFVALQKEGLMQLTAAGFKPDYLQIGRAQDLQLPSIEDTSLIILAAAYIGHTRLIDNIVINLMSIHNASIS